eukprot:TRINITY_DN22898_c0_g2_i1.p1 TRINITY_DN22898_c0_g2~~TRINITY_DN22898_c0_g2_i1.p1  ORF type:complete len:815 (+),score=68.62 TRINITY_DN22898_c0_g2_i1:342-2786(+)
MLHADHSVHDLVLDSSACPICNGSLEKGWPYVRVSLAGGAIGEKYREMCCHMTCVAKAIHAERSSGGQSVFLEASCSQSIKELLVRSPSLLYRNACVRLRGEEERMAQLGCSETVSSWPWPAFAPLPEAAFSVEGISEFQVCCCPSLCHLPADVGRMRWIQTLSLISNGLESIPPEVAMLKHLQYLYLNGNFLRTIPTEVGAAQSLREVCLDANQLEDVPRFSSPDLTLFTAPANKLKEFPLITAPLQRIELHGNNLSRIRVQYPDAAGRWYGLSSLKIMGNQLTELPSEICNMYDLRILSVSCNRLRCLPQGLSGLRQLEWLMAYENQLQWLPDDIATKCPRLTRILLEANPLQPRAVMTLLANVRNSYVKTLGLDYVQVHEAVSDSGNSWETLPECVSVGSIIHVGGCSQVNMKLTRASQLRRRSNVLALGEPGGPADPSAAPADFLVVAFGASQGEPEWLGFFRRLYEIGCVSPVPHQAEASLKDLLDGVDKTDFDSLMAKLWTGCPCGETLSPSKDDSSSLAISDFDVLTVVDCRMRWYAEDIDAVASALKGVCSKYTKVLCVGASMGGFGALLHGGRFAHSVVAFSPQANLLEACLRPPAGKPAALAELSGELFESLRAAKARDAQITVHCAADEHLMHAVAMPQDCLSLVVHPLCPRKPFARLLDRAELLMPIVSDVMYNMLVGKPSPCSRVSLGCWGKGGRLERHRAEPNEILNLFFSSGATMVPRPGDWFCGTCQARNMSQSFFCWRCKPKDGNFVSSIMASGSVRIVDGTTYPAAGDWGCMNCGAAMCGYERSCSNCGASKPQAR